MFLLLLILVLSPFNYSFERENNVDDRLLKFLNKIKMLESSGGTNLNHELIESGPQKGQRAIGSYALLPNTIKELVNRARLGGKMDDNLKRIQNQPDEKVREILTETPYIEEQLANILAERVLDKSKGDEERAAYGWNMGHNKNTQALTPEELDKSQYVQRFRKLRNVVGR